MASTGISTRPDCTMTEFRAFAHALASAVDALPEKVGTLTQAVNILTLTVNDHTTGLESISRY